MSLQSFQATIRYVLNEGRGTTLDDFVWSVVPVGGTKTVYRGQAGASTKAIAGDRSTPLQIATSRGRPISTSGLLTTKIESFAATPEGSGAVGRLFAIELQPGVQYAALNNQTPEELKAYNFVGKQKDAAQRRTLDAFRFLDAELPAGHGLKGKGVAAQSAVFFNFLRKEREVLLDPRKIQFVSDPTTKSPETWDRPLVPARSFSLTPSGATIEIPGSDPKQYETHSVDVYKTYAIPESGGARRHRRTRRKTRKHRRHQ